MELTKQNLLQSIEQLGRIFIAFMGEYYGKRMVEVNDEQMGKVSVQFDFSQLKSIPCSIDLDAGASTYWSEIANMQTLDNLLMQGKIPTSEYLRRLPSGQITDREALIAVVKAAEQGAMVDPSTLNLGGGNADAEAALRGGAGYGALQRKINETGEVPREVV